MKYQQFGPRAINNNNQVGVTISALRSNKTQGISMFSLMWPYQILIKQMKISILSQFYKQKWET